MDATDARTLVRTVARRMGVDPDAVLGRDRSLDVVRVRRVVVLELRARGASYRTIGAVLGRHHSTTARFLAPQRRPVAIPTPAVSP